MKEAGAAIVATLQAYAGLPALAPAGVWQDELPQNDLRAAVLVQKMSGVPGYSQSGMFERDLRYQVTGRVKVGDGATGEDIAAAILAALNLRSFAVAGHRLMLCKATGDVDYLDPPTGGVRFEYHGHLFKVEVAV